MVEYIREKERTYAMNDLKAVNCTGIKKTVSPMRKSYIGRLIARCMVFIAGLILYLRNSDCFDVIYGMNFFKKVSVIHILWAVWIMDMLLQLIPMKKYVPLGSHKLFDIRFKKTKGDFDLEGLKRYTSSEAKSAFIIFIVWALFIAVFGVLYHIEIIDERFLFMTSVFFYVCDLICVLIWCPFRVFMKNRCCTTCRIFNWDHLMMFSPLIFIGGFAANSLVIMAAAVWLVWEINVLRHPERFWEKTNEALKCSSCTDKLCTQYCEKNKR